jgi:hypothetical protein
MKKLLLLTLAGCSLFVSGCAQNVWHKPTARAGEFEQDRYACLQQSQQQRSVAQVGAYGGAAVSSAVTNDGLFSSCMNARGWSLTNAEAAQQIQQQQQSTYQARNNQAADDVNRLKLKSEERCASPAYKLYYEKTACVADNITFEQLTDKSKITPAQKQTLVKVRAMVDEVNKEQNRLARMHGGLIGAKRADLAESSLFPKNDKNNVELYEGKITWGEYNQRRKEIYINFMNEVKNIR